MNLDFSGKTALICGSTRGLGRASAEMMAGLGATIILMARSEEKLREVSRQLPANDEQQHRYAVADFSEPEQVKEAVEGLITSLPGIDILVNNSGGPAAGEAISADPNAFAAAFAQHLLCNQILTQAVVPDMKEARFGRIINIISTSVKQPIPGLGVSNTIRGAVANWAKTLANELGPFGITVNNVLPGPTDTERLQEVLTGRAKQSG